VIAPNVDSLTSQATGNTSSLTSCMGRCGVTHATCRCTASGSKPQCGDYASARCGSF
jgi:hypothetical protein